MPPESPVLAHDRVAATAHATDQQAREQEAPPVGAVEGLAALVAGHGETVQRCYSS